MRYAKFTIVMLLLGLAVAFFATGCSCSKEEKGSDYLQMTKDADQTIVDGSAISNKTVRKTTQETYDKNILNVTEDRSHLEKYKGHDADNDGMDDYEFIVSHCNVGLGLLKMVDLLDMLLGLLSNLSVDDVSIKPLATLAPGESSCGTKIDIGQYLSVVEGILPQFLDPIVNSFESAIEVDSGKKYNLVLSDNAKLVIGTGADAITINLAGEWDSGDVLLLTSGFNAIYGAISALLAFNTTAANPTVDGLLNMLITPCYGNPWVRSDVGPDFLKIYKPEKLQNAKPKLSNAIGEVRDALAFIDEETDPQDDDIIKYIDSDGDGKKELHIKLLESIPDAASIASTLADISEGINLTALSNLLGAIKTNIDSGSSAKVDLAKYITPLLPQNNDSDTTNDVPESEMQKKVGLLLDLSPVFNATAGTDFKEVLPLWVNGEDFTDSLNPKGVFNAGEAISDDVIADGILDTGAGECFDDANNNDSFDPGENWDDNAGWPKGISKNRKFDDTGDFYIISEMEIWIDRDDSTNKAKMCSTTFSDTFGFDVNDLFYDGSYGLATGDGFTHADVTHAWPDNSGTDPQNCVEDVVYLFFPDPTFKGILSAGANLSFTDGGSCTYTPTALDNAALNGIINNIYYILGPELSGLLGGISF